MERPERPERPIEKVLSENDVHILLVEDNADDVALTLRSFRKQLPNARVSVAHDGAEAVQVLENDMAGDLPDLVLLDVNMPKLSGIEVLERLRSRPATRLLPVVMFSTSRDRVDLERAYALGANSYVRKPVGYERFADVLREMGRYWLGLHVMPADPPSHRTRG